MNKGTLLLLLSSLLLCTLTLLWSGTTANADLIGHWKLDVFDNPISGQTRDELGLHHANLLNVPTLKSGKFGCAMWCNGVSGQGAVAYDSDGGLTLGTSDFTAAWWVNLDTNAQPGGEFSFIEKFTGAGGPNTGWTIYSRNHNAPANNLRDVEFYSGNIGSVTWGAGGGIEFIPGQWYHMALTRSGNLFTLYINGQSMGGQSLGAPNANVGDSGDDVWMGRRNASAPGQFFYLDGGLDDVRLYNAALDNTAVAELMNAYAKCRSDFNEDGLVNLLDLQVYAEEWLSARCLACIPCLTNPGDTGLGDGWRFHGQIDFVPQIVGYTDGFPIYAIGDVQIYSRSPDFVAGAALQTGNGLPKTKITPKQSWQIRSNYIGMTPPRIPRSEAGEEYPFNAVHLIDGDPATNWCSRPQVADGVESTWLRIDLPAENTVNKVVIIPRNNATVVGMPKAFSIELSTDAKNWETVYQTTDYPRPPAGEPQVFSFSSRQARQMRLVAGSLVWETGSPYEGYLMSLAEVQVQNPAGENLALVSRGAGVTVSSTNYDFKTKRETNNLMWPVHWDLGIKWIRVGYFNDRTNWAIVEQEKGKYNLDPISEAAILLAIDKGMEVTLTLGFGNPAYQVPGWEPPQLWLDLRESYIGNVPDTPEIIEAFCDYARFMAQRFKGRIKYYEIWNEPPKDPAVMVPLTIAASQAIKEVDPSAKIIMGAYYDAGYAFSTYIQNCLSMGVANYIDVISWHPYRHPRMPEIPANPAYQLYDLEVQALRSMAAGYGFNGEFMANEDTYFSSYPPSPVTHISELTKAKYAMRDVMVHARLGIQLFWNETWNNQFLTRAIGLFRNGPSAEPDSPMTPQAAYYAMRTLATVMDGGEPTPLSVQLSNFSGSEPFETAAFALPDGNLLLAVWLRVEGNDNFAAKTGDLRIPMISQNVVGIDTLNGTEQQLVFSVNGGFTNVNSILLRDYPIFLRIEQ